MKMMAGVLLALTVALSCQSRAQLNITKVYDEVGIDQRLNNQIPLALAFRDESGKMVTLDEYFHHGPVVLSLVYYTCPMLCTQILTGMVDGFRGLSFTAGKEFTVVTVSINPKETPEMAIAKKDYFLGSYNRNGAENGWHFLTGDQASIRKLADAVGYHYLYDSTSGQFAHASGIMVLTPDGRLSHYFYGIEYDPKDLKFALMDASKNRIGSVVDQLVLLCYHYDPSTGKYGLVVANVFRVAGVVTVLVVGGGILILLRRERRKRAKVLSPSHS